MASNPKKNAAVAAVVSVPALERGIEAAPDTETNFEPATPPFVDQTPAIETVPVATAEPLVEAAQASVAETTQVVEAASAATSEVAAQPLAAVTKILEAPMASLTEAQGKVRELVETGLSETHSKYTQIKSAADEAAHALESSYATVKNGAVQFNVKALEALSETANANFAFFKSVFAVKSPSDYVTLQTEFARKQIELATAQTKAFGELAQKVAAETIEPIKAQVAKTFNVR
jgi:phasin